MPDSIRAFSACHLPTLLSIVSTAALLSACSGAPSTPDEKLGTLRAALVAYDTDGAEYEFPPGTILLVQNSAGTFGDYWGLYGPEHELSVPLPAGHFTADVHLYDGSLFRTQGGVTEPVSVELMNAPLAFDVVPDRTTLLTLQYRVQDYADIEFSMGALDVELEVNKARAAQFTRLVQTGQWQIESAEPAGPLTDLIGTAGNIRLSATRSGDWRVETHNVACAPIELQTASVSEPSGQLAELLQVFEGQSAVFGVADNGAHDVGGISVERHRADAPRFLQTEFPGQYDFHMVASFDYGTDIYDGERIQQAKLAAALSSSSLSFVEVWAADAINGRVFDVHGSVRDGRVTLEGSAP